jgi:hypothetical protein
MSMDAKPKTINELADKFGFDRHRLDRIVERRQLQPAEIRGGVALFDPAEIRELVRLLPNNTSRSR